MAPRPHLQATLSFSKQAIGLIDYGSCSYLTFYITTSTKKQSRLRRLKNGVPQDSVLALLFFNIYTYDLPVRVARKFAYAILHYASDWQALEDIATLSFYFYKWKLKLSTTKTGSAAFHLCNKEAPLELNIFVNR